MLSPWLPQPDVLTPTREMFLRLSAVDPANPTPLEVEWAIRQERRLPEWRTFYLRLLRVKTLRLLRARLLESEYVVSLGRELEKVEAMLRDLESLGSPLAEESRSSSPPA